jgi:hypothetical protein
VIPEAIIAAALLGGPQGPKLSRARADYLAGAIALEAQDDLDAAAALIVTGERESSCRAAVERCGIPGLGGWGAFGVAELWTPRFPGGTCGPITSQARAARAIWLTGYRATLSVGGAFGRYIGALAGAQHPEARTRTRIFWRVRAELECACSI